MRRFTWRAVLGVAGVVAMLPGVVFAVIYVRFQCFPGRNPTRGTPADVGLTYQEVRRTGADGINTVGWYIPPISAPAPSVCLIHGHASRKEQLLENAAMLHRGGFGVALFDLRQHGDSDAAVCTIGVREAEDVRPWIAYLRARPEHAGRKLGLLGYSMGAVTALHTAAVCPEVATVVADSPFASLSDEVRFRLSRIVPESLNGYTWFFTLSVGCLTTQQLPSSWEVTGWLPQIAPRPVLLIHGTDDQNIPCTATEQLARAGGPNVQSWLVPHAGHTQARKHDPAAYETRVNGFLRQALN